MLGVVVGGGERVEERNSGWILLSSGSFSLGGLVVASDWAVEDDMVDEGRSITLSRDRLICELCRWRCGDRPWSS